MSRRATMAWGAAVVLGFLCLLLATDEWGAGTRPDGSPRWCYLLEDEHDRCVYQQRGRWLPSGRTPYIEEWSEYPQLATWLFGLPYLLFDHHVPTGVPQPAAGLRADRSAYYDLHQVLMSMALLALLWLTARALEALGRSPGWSLLLLLPASLYFSLNRFDAVPAACTGYALLAQLRGRGRTAAAALAVGALFKWYPALLLPLFLSHALRQPGPEGEATRARVARTVLVPGLVALAVVATVMAITWSWGGGGLEAILAPYRHHATRGPNPSSLVFALTEPRRWAWFDLSARDAVASVCMALQFLPALVLPFAPLRSRQALILACLCTVTGFVLLGKVFSPQWVVWIAPWAILAAPGRRGLVACLVAFEVLVYLQMPVFYYEGLRFEAGRGMRSDAFWTLSALRVGACSVLLAWSWTTLLRTVLPGPPAIPWLARTRKP